MSLTSKLLVYGVIFTGMAAFGYMRRDRPARKPVVGTKAFRAILAVMFAVGIVSVAVGLLRVVSN